MSDFPISKDAYVAFDGLTIKQKIKDRLNTTGIFTDQNFEGSNLAAINDSVAMSFSLLLYYLNQESASGDFDQTKVYEVMNRIVKELDYKPVGHQTSTVGFTLSAKNLAAGFYNIPRYSTISIGGLPFSLSKDLSFTKSLNNTLEEITGIEGDALLFQGTYIEMPIFSPAGTPNEIIHLTTDDRTMVDNFTVDVYVNSGNGWEKWRRTQSLYISNSVDSAYELRFNENRRYELKFGDGINGQKLAPTDRILVYYLASNGKDGELGTGGLTNKKMTPYISGNLQLILNHTGTRYMTGDQIQQLSFYNKFPSTYYAEPETVESIRKNAPGVFRSQFNVTTRKSHETFLRSNFSNILHDVKAKNNKEYLDSYIKYFHGLGLTKPQFESRALFNQVNFADSCNFNNVYITAVPKTIRNSLAYLTPSQKELIYSTIRDEQVLTSDILISDPVYIAFDFCAPVANSITKLDVTNSELVVVRSNSSRRNQASIHADVVGAIQKFFDPTTNFLGQSINVQQLNTTLLGVEGVSQILTRNKSDGTSLEGVQMVYWNPVYFDITVTEAVSMVQLEDFQFPFLEYKQIERRVTIR